MRSHGVSKATSNGNGSEMGPDRRMLVMTLVLRSVCGICMILPSTPRKMVESWRGQLGNAANGSARGAFP